MPGEGKLLEPSGNTIALKISLSVIVSLLPSADNLVNMWSVGEVMRYGAECCSKGECPRFKPVQTFLMDVEFMM